MFLTVVVSLPQMLPSKDANFVGYTYKNFEIVNDNEMAGIGRLLTDLHIYIYTHKHIYLSYFEFTGA